MFIDSKRVTPTVMIETIIEYSVQVCGHIILRERYIFLFAIIFLRNVWKCVMVLHLFNQYDVSNS